MSTAAVILNYNDADTTIEAVERIRDFCTGLGLPTLEYDEASYENGSYIDEYCGFYDRL